MGWRVLRFWNNDVLQQIDPVLETILRACEERCKGKPSPYPLPHAGEGKDAACDGTHYQIVMRCSGATYILSPCLMSNAVKNAG